MILFLLILLTTPINGMEIHPESGSAFNITANSGVGLKNVHYELTWGRDGKIENDVELKNVPSYLVNLPIAADSPKGLVNLPSSFSFRSCDISVGCKVIIIQCRYRIFVIR